MTIQNPKGKPAIMIHYRDIVDIDEIKPIGASGINFQDLKKNKWSFDFKVKVRMTREPLFT